MTHNNLPDFAAFEKRMRLEGLPESVIDNFGYYYGILASGTTGFIGEQDIAPVESVTCQSDIGHYAEAGAEAIGRSVILKLNGGLGTSMGLDQAKSLLVARDKLTFLDIIARQSLSFSSRYDCHVPLVLMNSFNTDADSRAVLSRYPELQGDIPLTMMQNKVPKVDQRTLRPVEWPENPALEWCPPGHGEIYLVLKISGMLDALLDHGYEYLFISNVDNLGATLDLSILGYVAQRQIPFLMEVARRTEADKKGGHLARRKDGRLLLREVAQCPQEDIDAFQDIRKYRYFNTNNIWVNLARLKHILAENRNVLKLPMIRNSKTVDPKDSQTPPVYQLETAMGAAIEIFPDAGVLQVERDRFMPVKTCSDLLGLRSDMYVLEEDYRLRPNPERSIGPISISLDDEYYKLVDDFEARFPYDPPSLVGCASLAVRGDVLFEGGITFKGDVEIVNQSEAQRHLPAGSVVEDTRYDLEGSTN